LATVTGTPTHTKPIIRSLDWKDTGYNLRVGNAHQS
jgi:hypothetical protein